MFLVQAAAFLLMPLLGAQSFVVLCVLASAVTSCYGGGYATMSALSTAYYGLRDIGTIYGSMSPRRRSQASARLFSWRVRRI